MKGLLISMEFLVIDKPQMDTKQERYLIGKALQLQV